MLTQDGGIITCLVSFATSSVSSGNKTVLVLLRFLSSSISVGEIVSDNGGASYKDSNRDVLTFLNTC